MSKFTTNVRGITYAKRENPELNNLELKRGDVLELVAEPENTYDPKAIKILHDGVRIGYLPKKTSKQNDFSIQLWCHQHLDSVKCYVEEAWYKDENGFSADVVDGGDLSGVYVTLETPFDSKAAKTDVVITKRSFCEPDIIVDFNETQHIYNMRTPNGYKTLKGGTTFAGRFYDKFNANMVSINCEKAWKVDRETIKDLWKSNGRLTADFGTVIHSALEHFVVYGDVGETIQKNKKECKHNYALPKHPFIKKIITSLNRITKKLDKQYGAERAVAEALVTDSSTRWGGLIDRLLIIDEKKKICRVQDYKVNIGAEEISKELKPKKPFSHLPANKLTKYGLQLTFYSELLKKAGWTVEGLDVFVFEDKWVHYEMDLIDFSALKKDNKEE